MQHMIQIPQFVPLCRSTSERGKERNRDKQSEREPGSPILHVIFVDFGTRTQGQELCHFGRGASVSSTPVGTFPVV